MYAAYFNLREPPFSIAPDPAFLYMSSRHQEALGHLLYGTGQFGGFVQLTGEVGTGKTTIVRTLLVQKLDNVDVAMIHNPRQSELEFVASICDELGVPYDKPATSIKALVDGLNDHLLRAHAAGRRTVLIIDEAQNLAPSVLEQVRLLTNLETDKEKLLRIMLIGQPELIELLARPELRQLASRITARYHLTPLSAAETSQYIMHRLRVAGGPADLFGEAAMRRVHRLANGVPRLVNIICDRALLGAYAKGTRAVTPDIVERAGAETLGSAPAPRRTSPAPGGWPELLRRRPLLLIEAALAIAALIIAGVMLRAYLGTAAAPGPPQRAAAAVPEAQPPAAAPAAAAAPIAPTDSWSATAPAPTAGSADTPGASQAPAQSSPAAAEAVAQPAAAQAAEPPQAAAEALRQGAEPLAPVLARLIGLWDPKIVIAAGENVCAALAQRRLQCYTGVGPWAELAAINRPAILTLNPAGGETRYVLLRSLERDAAVLQTAGGSLRLPPAQLENIWNGQYLLLWRSETDQLSFAPGSHGAAIAWIRERLTMAAGKPVTLPLPERYDERLRESVKQFQASHGLKVDGIAGVRTLMALAEVQRPAGTPTLESGG
ncbi:MAG: AAA family ATPase [Nevskia sp.]|nr:AAA family ATPase [Nevskia sp.]